MATEGEGTDQERMRLANEFRKGRREALEEAARIVEDFQPLYHENDEVSRVQPGGGE